MKLHSLKLNFFRQHKNTELQFKDGTTGIIGLNGAGKTSLVEAIAFALYGSRAVRGKLEGLKTKGGLKTDKLRARLTFQHEGRIHTVDRTLDNAELFISGQSEPIAIGSREVTERVKDLLRMTYEEFLATYFTEQKGLEFLSGKRGRAEREKFIVRMMGLDRLEKIQERLRLDRRDLRNKVRGWEAGLGSREELLEQVDSDHKQVEKTNSKYTETKTNLEKSNREMEKSKNDLLNLEKLRKQFLSLHEQSKQKQTKYAEANGRIVALQDEQQQVYRELESSPQGLTLVKSGKLEEKLKDLKAKSQKGDALIAELRSKLSKLELEWRESLVTLEKEQALIDADYAKLAKQNKQFANLGQDSHCPTCRQELGSQFDAVKQAIVKELKDLALKRDSLQERVKLLKATPQDIVAERSQLEEKQTELDSAKLELSNLSQLLMYDRNLKRIKQGLDLEKSALNAIQKEIDDLQKLILELDFSEEDYNQKKVAFETAERLNSISRLDHTRAESSLDNAKTHLERSKKAVLDYDARLEQLKLSRRQLVVMEEGDRLLTDFRKHLNTAIRPRLAELASQFITELTDGRYTEVDISEDFQPGVIEDGQTKEVISGGEEDILNLCLRLALSNLLAERAGQSFSLLILDEVFGSLDEGRRNNLIHLLDRLNNRFEQILLITHIDEVKDAVSNLIYVNFDDRAGTVVVDNEEAEQKLVYNL